MSDRIAELAQNLSPEQKRKSVLGAFEILVQAEREGLLTEEMKFGCISEAWSYAHKNKIPYDGTFKGAMKLAEQANDMVQRHNEIEQREHRRQVEERRRKLGVKGSTRVKDLIN